MSSSMSVGLLALAALLPGGLAYNYQGCVSSVAKALPYCDMTLSHAERIDWLVDRLSVGEMIGLISCPDSNVNCNMPSSPIPRFGVPSYVWLVETNTGVHSRCLGENQCSTIFPDPMGMAASFNRTLWRAKGSVIGTEMRGLSNGGGYINTGDDLKSGLSGFGPNLNLVRDPRAGRNQETPSEDPFLSGSYAVEYVKGMQEKDKNGYPKINAYLKHFAVYSREYYRQHQDNMISEFDLFDSFLPQYEMAFTRANASGVMCAYTGMNGTTACSNGRLQNDIMRKQWGQPDALSFSDCGAVSETRQYPWNVESDAESAAIAIMNGTDIEAGSNLYTFTLNQSVETGRVPLARLKEAAKRTLSHRFRLGLFDDPQQVEWTSIPPSAVGSAPHQELNLEAALQGLVLLRNDDLLPLKKGIKLAVVGPHSLSRQYLFSDYYGLETCWNGGNLSSLNFSCVGNLHEAISYVNQGGTTTSQPGVKFIGGDDGGLNEAIQAAVEADIVVLALGTVGINSMDIEHESFDRSTTTLPGLQEQFAYEILKINKPTALVLVNGNPIAIDNLLPVDAGSKVNKLGVRAPDAIIEAFFPGARGAEAIAKALFGEENRWGKLPVTMYPAAYANLVDIEDYSMTKSPGRTHRYYQGQPLFPFGFGLSLSKFDIKCSDGEMMSDSNMYTCEVRNAGPFDGEEVVQLYHKAPASVRRNAKHPVPLKQLVDFERVFVKAGESVEVKFEVESKSLRLTDENGHRKLYSGSHLLVFTNGVQQAEFKFDV